MGFQHEYFHQRLNFRRFTYIIIIPVRTCLKWHITMSRLDQDGDGARPAILELLYQNYNSLNLTCDVNWLVLITVMPYRMIELQFVFQAIDTYKVCDQSVVVA